MIRSPNGLVLQEKGLAEWRTSAVFSMKKGLAAVLHHCGTAVVLSSGLRGFPRQSLSADGSDVKNGRQDNENENPLGSIYT